MSIYAFRRMREQNEAASKAASVSSLKPILKIKPKKENLNGNNNNSNSRKRVSK